MPNGETQLKLNFKQEQERKRDQKAALMRNVLIHFFSLTRHKEQVTILYIQSTLEECDFRSLYV